MDQNIIVLFGGDSEERLVSVASAQTISHALRPNKLWFWHKDGRIFEINHNELLAHKNPFIDEFKPNKLPIFNTINDAIASSISNNHVFVLAVHGGSGENGSLQEILEKYHRPFTGSNAHASRVTFNKVSTKECLMGHDIAMAPHMILETNNIEHMKRVALEFFNAHGEIICKPVACGSSLGCFFIRTSNDVDPVIKELTKWQPQPFLLERVIHGREITVSVIETDQGPKALVGSEVLLDKDHQFDYQGKYLGRGTKEITPAELDRDCMGEAQALAVKAHTLLSLDGYSRTDMILAQDGFYFLETNTLPGLSKQSFLPQQLAACGITLAEFLRDQIRFALQKNHPAGV